MGLSVSAIQVWTASIEDQPGALAEKLAALAEADANFEFVLARRKADLPGEAVVFLAPVKGVRQIDAAKQAGFVQTDEFHAVRVEGQDRPGLGAEITKALANEGINLRGLSAAVVGKQFVIHLALDSEEEAANVNWLLKRIE